MYNPNTVIWNDAMLCFRLIYSFHASVKLSGPEKVNVLITTVIFTEF